MSKVVPFSRPQSGPKIDAETVELYAPALMFTGLKVPVREMAEELKKDAYMDGVLPDFQPYITFKDGSEDNADVIAFPMPAEAYLKYGVLLMEHFHSLCFGAFSADDGNEFLCCYKDSMGDQEDAEPPAAEMYAVLYLSSDGGSTWISARQFEITSTNRASKN